MCQQKKTSGWVETVYPHTWIYGARFHVFQGRTLLAGYAYAKPSHTLVAFENAEQPHHALASQNSALCTITRIYCYIHHSPKKGIFASLRENLLQILHSRALLLNLGHAEARSERVLSVLDAQDFFLHRVLNDKPLHYDCTRLSNSVYAIDGLSFDRIIPPRVLYDPKRAGKK